MYPSQEDVYHFVDCRKPVYFKVGPPQNGPDTPLQSYHKNITAIDKAQADFSKEPTFPVDKKDPDC
jgi:hypothetical protein